MPHMFDAVVAVTTRNRASSLDRCLTAVAADSSQVSREILVVDNGSTDDTAEVVSQHAEHAVWPVRVVRGARPGVARARNIAVAASEAPLILFVIAVFNLWIYAKGGFDGMPTSRADEPAAKQDSEFV